MRAPESVILRREPEVRDRIGSGWSCVCMCRRHASARSARRFRLPREFCQEGRGAACPMRPCSRHRFRTDACGYFAITRRGYPARTSPARAATQKSLPNGRLAVQGKRRNDTSRAMSFPTLALPRSGAAVGGGLATLSAWLPQAPVRVCDCKGRCATGQPPPASSSVARRAPAGNARRRGRLRVL